MIAAEIPTVSAGTTTKAIGNQRLFGSIIAPGIAPMPTAHNVQTKEDTIFAASNFSRLIPEMAATLAVGALRGPEKYAINIAAKPNRWNSMRARFVIPGRVRSRGIF